MVVRIPIEDSIKRPSHLPAQEDPVPVRRVSVRMSEKRIVGNPDHPWEREGSSEGDRSFFSGKKPPRGFV